MDAVIRIHQTKRLRLISPPFGPGAQRRHRKKCDKYDSGWGDASGRFNFGSPTAEKHRSPLLIPIGLSVNVLRRLTCHGSDSGPMRSREPLAESSTHLTIRYPCAVV